MAAFIASVSPPAAFAQLTCFGDCNNDGRLTASDIGRINATLLRCSPCEGGVPGGVTAGCPMAPLPGPGCIAADFNSDGCLRASELGRANQNILRFPPDGCATALFTIGASTGSPGQQVDVPIVLTSNGREVVTIAPLVIEFNPAVLAFDGCSAIGEGKIAFFGSPSPERASVVVIDNVFDGDGQTSSGLTVFPDGPVLSCSFTIEPSAAPGATALIFVLAGLADSQYNDFNAVGANGSIMVQ
jgi:hypothetical protein